MCKYHNKALYKSKSCTDENTSSFFLLLFFCVFFYAGFQLHTVNAVVLFVQHVYNASETALGLNLGVRAKLLRRVVFSSHSSRFR